ncbi:energy transducer TonB [Bradyrhizobium cenepequi]|uniref:energy transducer TonB n=1 Tax=Bradyrhizobium cenepequi TaxID=2821403 RepID=UPI001CE2A05A|nr:energy transducer TonB [Bradyrhizobium cenepequi]MCA6109657.1 energy transducer TonB [Bradyrhizobium cenepequi]
MIAAGWWSKASAQSATSETKIQFNIPAQPLSRALVDYAAATGLEIFYKAALADNRHSTAVAGVLMPSTALQILLRGTGYTARSTGVGAFTIMPAPREVPAAAEARKRLQPYFAVVQTGISDALCRNAPGAADKEILLQLWLSSSGLVTRAEVIDDDGKAARDQSYAAAIRGLAFAIPPPGMPQPVNVVIFPSFKASRTCGPVNAARGGR